ncbi:NAD(P)-dependent dehydrogenase (short-subunit alcohol dehydrogenase family) [Rhodoligotrophos appendicifer]|uniref:hypothetical protein n=1 Tax=Rhodoligotrophos appendicifer TaxID=987056 RepID=UPI00147862C8|nr:hypothetical protein [Rhodoligotrophos appendicifer]
MKIAEDEWDRTVDVTLKRTDLTCQAGMPSVRESGCGRVVTAPAIIVEWKMFP